MNHFRNRDNKTESHWQRPEGAGTKVKSARVDAQSAYLFWRKTALILMSLFVCLLALITHLLQSERPSSVDHPTSPAVVNTASANNNAIFNNAPVSPSSVTPSLITSSEAAPNHETSNSHSPTENLNNDGLALQSILGQIQQAKKLIDAGDQLSLQKSHQMLQRLLTEHPDGNDMATIYYNLGAIEARRGNWVSAEQNYKTALEVVPTHPASLAGLGYVHKKMGDGFSDDGDDYHAKPFYIAAEQDLRTALLNHPKPDVCEDANFWLAEVIAKMGQKHSAKQMLEDIATHSSREFMIAQARQQLALLRN